MPKKKYLYLMTWDEVQEEMSVAGSREKIRRMGEKFMERLKAEGNLKDQAHMINALFAVEKIKSELRGIQKANTERINKSIDKSLATLKKKNLGDHF